MPTNQYEELRDMPKKSSSPESVSSSKKFLIPPQMVEREENNKVSDPKKAKPFDGYLSPQKRGKSQNSKSNNIIIGKAKPPTPRKLI